MDIPVTFTGNITASVDPDRIGELFAAAIANAGVTRQDAQAQGNAAAASAAAHSEANLRQAQADAQANPESAAPTQVLATESEAIAALRRDVDHANEEANRAHTRIDLHDTWFQQIWDWGQNVDNWEAGFLGTDGFSRPAFLVAWPVVFVLMYIVIVVATGWVAALFCAGVLALSLGAYIGVFFGGREARRQRRDHNRDNH